MKRTKENSGFSLVELIVVIAIMAVLVAIIAPQFIKYVEKARQSKVKQEADAFYQAAQVSLVDWGTQAESSFYADQFTIKGGKSNGKKCGRITNWSIMHTDDSLNKNMCEILMSNLNVSNDVKISSIPMSSTVPNSNGSATPLSLGEEAVFQFLYDEDFNITLEYNRNGYFVRIDGEENKLWNLKDAEDKKDSDCGFTPLLQRYNTQR